jgi:hypothetical protein
MLSRRIGTTGNVCIILKAAFDPEIYVPPDDRNRITA